MTTYVMVAFNDLCFKERLKPSEQRSLQKRPPVVNTVIELFESFAEMAHSWRQQDTGLMAEKLKQGKHF